MRPPKHTALLILLVGCLAAAGCGSDEEGAPIPADSATALDTQLASIQSRLEAGPDACEDVANSDDPNTRAVEQLIEGLPSDVDQDVRDALQQGFDRLFELVQERCTELRDEAQTETDGVEPEPEPEPTAPTETLPPDTDTTPTDTTEQPTTPTVPDVPSDEGGSGDEEGGGILAPGGDDG